jgi:hypothetical protein
VSHERALETWISTAEAAALLDVDARVVRRQIARGHLIGRQAGTDWQVQLASLPQLAQELYQAQHATPCGLEEQDTRDRLGRFAGRPDVLEAFLGEATRRASILRRYEATEPKRVRGQVAPAVEALLEEWRATDPKVLSVEPSWGRRPCWRTLHNALAALKRTGDPVVLIPAPPRVVRVDDRRVRAVDPEILTEAVKLRLGHLPNATTASLARRLEKSHGDRAPGRQRLGELIDEHIPPAVQVYHRQGPKTYRAEVSAPIMRDWSHLDIGEAWCGDHHQLDIEVIDPAKRGGLSRPWLTMWMDLRSRAPVGWMLRLESPSSTAIAAAFAHGVLPKRDPVFRQLCGSPQVAYVDNGKDYRSAALEALLRACGVETIHAIPYNAKAKVVERLFRTVCLQFSQDFETWCGNSPAARTERYDDLRAEHDRWRKGEVEKTAFLTLPALSERFASWVVEYLQRPHDGLKERGTGRELTPLLVSQWRRSPVRIPKDERSIAFYAWPSWTRTVRKGQVRLDDHHYHAEALLSWEGAEVQCRRDPDDVTRLLIFALQDGHGVRAGGAIGAAVSRRVAALAERHGDKSERLLSALMRQRRDEEKTIRGYLAIQERRLRGVGLEELPTAPPPPATVPTAADTVTECPEGAIPQILPSDRFASVVPAAPAPLTPAVSIAKEPPTLEEQAEEYVLHMCGHRPTAPEFCDHFTRALIEREIRDWEEQRSFYLSSFYAQRRMEAG